jgi:hypothetical protein
VGALIGLAIQLLIMAMSLMVMLLVWTARITIMLVSMVIAAISSRSRQTPG